MLAPKRNRTSVSCNVCKARKVRCDREKPCLLCVRHKTAFICEYDDIPGGLAEPPAKRLRSAGSDSVYLVPTSLTSVLSRFVEYLEVVGVNPIRNSEPDSIDFYDGFNSMSYDPLSTEHLNNGPLSWQALLRLDRGLSDLWAFIVDNRPGRPENSTSIFKKPPPGIDDSVNNPLRILDRIRKHSEEKFDPQNARLNSTNLPLGLTFNDPNSRKQNIGYEERLLGILPPKRILWLHIECFFRHIYPFVPYLDERAFRENISALLGPVDFSNERVASIRISLKADLCYLGLLCLVLRMSYLSLISNNVKENQLEPEELEGLKYLLLCPIGIEYVDFARICLTNLHQIANRLSLLVLQLFVYTRIYMEMAPEDTDGPGRDSFQVNNGMLLHMAQSLGLNREPDKMIDPFAFKDLRVNHIRRKLWWFVKTKELVNSCKFGTPLSFQANFSDTKMPFTTETNRNNLHGHDALVELALEPQQKLMELLRKLLTDILSLDGPTDIQRLVSGTNELESYVFEHFGTLRDFAEAFKRTDDHSLAKMLQLQIYIPVQVCILMCHHRLFLKYEKMDNRGLLFFYLRKIYNFLAHEGVPYVNEMLEKPHPRFGWTFHLVNNASMEHFLHRLIGLYAGVVSRLGHQIVLRFAEEPRVFRLKLLMRLLARNCIVCVLGMYKMTHRYCYAWRIATTFTYVIRTLICQGFYVREGAKQGIAAVEYSDDQISDLVDLLKEPIAMLDISAFNSYLKTVADVIGMGPGKDPGVFNPLESEIVYADVPDDLPEADAALDLGIFENAWGDLMGLFFGPEEYFEAFSVN